MKTKNSSPNFRTKRALGLTVLLGLFFLSFGFTFILFSSFISAADLQFSKIGNNFSSTTGNYATLDHCMVGQTCGWISGNQVIVGAYYADPDNWAGSVTWNFNLSGVDLTNLESAYIVILWPGAVGKGLHSTVPTGQGIIKINNNELKRLVTNYTQLTDWFAHNPYEFSLTYDLPVNYLSASTNVNLETTLKTAWDVSEIRLILRQKSGAINCSSNLECGTNSWVNSVTCSNNDVYQNYKTFICNNPGIISSYCSNSVALSKKQECGANSSDAWSSNKCEGSNVIKTRVSYVRGCNVGSCFSNNLTEKQIVQTCTSDQICSSGQCVANVAVKNITIVNGKIKIRGNEFIIRGVDYAPWIVGTGPDPTPGLGQTAFPNEYADVTDKMSNSGIISVRDYNSDGKIQTWEVVQYDLEKMKAVGANTIRVYSTGFWHDKNLNGVQDGGETIQGDLPDWVLDRMLNFANSNNMKVLIGYWVQEENMVTPMVCDSTDLQVAKQSFGRIVNKYKNNNAVLGWAIGNEVHLSGNHQWFTWGVDINTYLNSLNTYVRTLDANHPIIYSKYVGENVNFNNINADIIAINAYTHAAGSFSGEFSIAAPAGKAYMLGEYAHNIADAAGHWDLSKQYAGGCFLEYNDVWWKTGAAFGIVTKYREIRPERYNVLLGLYGGSPICSSNSQCGTSSWQGNLYCNSNNVYQNYRTYSCNNAGTLSSYCSQTNVGKLKESCSFGCSNGQCSSPSGKKADLSVYNPSDGKWYIVGLNNNQPILFGIAGDKPASADFDGDGKVDISVFRKEKNTYVTLETNGGTMWDIGTIKLLVTLKDGRVLTFSKNGNQYSSVTGSYVSSSYCNVDTCRWIIGNQIILGMYYDSNSATASWSFDLSSINVNDIKSANVVVSWSSSYGKGLHNSNNNGLGIIKVNNVEIRRLATNVASCIPSNDRFAHGCAVSSLSASASANQVIPSIFNWYILQTSNNKVLTKSWGFSGTLSAPADFDGDGKADLTVYNPADSKWYILQTSTNSMVTKAWGFAGTIPAPADFDGDKKADLTVYTPSDGKWYIWQTSTNSMVTKSWGFLGTLPSPGDYNGA